MRGAPACFGLDDVTPESDLAEDATNGSGLVAAPEVGEGVRRVARGVEAAVAREARHGMERQRLGERILVPATGRQHRLVERPRKLMQDRAEPQACRRLHDDPGAPA